MSSILQWRRLAAKRSDESISCDTFFKKDEGLNEGTNAGEGFSFSGKIEEPKQYRSHEKQLQQKNVGDKVDSRRVARSNIGSKMHIVQCKKAWYSHLSSSQKVMPKDEYNYPIVYESRKRHGRKESAPLWLVPFRVDDD